jgi:hypothetical protein
MKCEIISVVVLVGASLCFGQDIDFANFGNGIDAPITNAGGTAIAGSTSYVADLFWSTNLSAGFEELSQAGYDQPFTGSGYFLGGAKTLVWTLILAQVRVWDTNYGSTYYQARDHGGEFGFSNFITLTPSLGPGPPTALVGLRSFRLQRLPYVTSTVTTTNTLVFSWPTEQTAYAVQQNPDLSPTNWVTLPNTPVTVGQSQQVILPAPTNGRLFYRLVSQ